MHSGVNGLVIILTVNLTSRMLNTTPQDLDLMGLLPDQLFSGLSPQPKKYFLTVHNSTDV